MFDIPITIIIFNRPRETKALLARLSIIKPKILYVISDGSRLSKKDDYHKVKETRNLVDKIDWDCNVTKIYSDVNMGCMMRVSSGLTSVFDKEKNSIILEDDCIPDISYFAFAEQMLLKYQDDCRVMSICGTRIANDVLEQESSYTFSKYSICWGWATWSRAWKLYTHDLINLDNNINTHYLDYYLGGKRAGFYWKFILKKLKAGKINSWAYRWMYSCWVNNGLSIVPKVNLVKNIGMGEEATHTTYENVFLNRDSQELVFPLYHPESIQCDFTLDEWIEDHFYSKSIRARFFWLANKLLQNQ